MHSRRGPCCIVPGCSLRSGTNLLSRIRSFTFPADERRRNAWIAAVNRDNWYPTKSSRICSAHFIQGQPSSDPNHPDYVPSLFLYRSNGTLLQNSVYFHCANRKYTSEGAEEQLQESTTFPQLQETSTVRATCGPLPEAGAEHRAAATSRALPQPKPKLWRTSPATGATQQTSRCPVTGHNTSSQMRNHFRPLLPKDGISRTMWIQYVKLPGSEEQEVPSVSGQQHSPDDHELSQKVQLISTTQMESLHLEKTNVAPMVLLVEAPPLPLPVLGLEVHKTAAAACDDDSNAIMSQRPWICECSGRAATSAVATQTGILKCSVSTQTAKLKHGITTQAGTIMCQAATQT
ncbi:uncharacterized protein LOC144099010 isoform X1 [Amblyomma americanum]